MPLALVVYQILEHMMTPSQNKHPLKKVSEWEPYMCA